MKVSTNKYTELVNLAFRIKTHFTVLASIIQFARPSGGGRGDNTL